MKQLLAGTLATAMLLVGAIQSHAQSCGDPSGDGGVKASDALTTLQTAVGSTSCDPCLCDVVGMNGISATDALVVLQFAVGQQVTLDCPPCATTTTTMSGGGADCTNDGNCFNDDCVCSDCDFDLFCSDPANCNHDGTCQTFLEGCVCDDCTTQPECLDN